MRTRSYLSGLFAVLLLGAHSALPQSTIFNEEVRTSVDRAFEPAPANCSDVRWSQAALRTFPTIASACQAVEQRNGKSYVKLEGTVESVRDSGSRLRVDFEDGGELTLRPPGRMRLYIDGQPQSFADIEAGTRLNFYIPEDRLQAELKPDPARVAFVIVPLDITGSASAAQSAAARNRGELPRTAGPLPLLGVGGLAFALLASACMLWRKLQR
jgi:hypothetical protein